jgi:hypothetical protein
MPSAGSQPLTTTSTTSSLEASFQNLNSRIVKDRVGLPMAFRAGNYPSSEEQAAVTDSIAAARSALQAVATPAEIAKFIRLLSGGLKVNGNMDAEAVAEAYMFALDGVKRAVLDKAVRTLLRRGAPESMSKTFMPSAPDLLAYCDQIERDALAMVVLTERLLALPEERLPEPIPEEQCQAMRQKIALLAKPRMMEAE